MTPATTRERGPGAEGEGEGVPRPYGILAEFAGADDLVAAARRLRAAGYRKVEAYSPFPVDGLDEALGATQPGVAAITFVGALVGGVAAYALEWWSAVIDYPIAVGGRPLHSWPMFIPVTFEMAVLGGALAAFGAFLAGARLPSLHHPLFAAPEFDLATRNRFFLAVRADDPAFDIARTGELIAALAPIATSTVEST